MTTAKGAVTNKANWDLDKKKVKMDSTSWLRSLVDKTDH